MAFIDDFLHLEFGALQRDAERGNLMVESEFGKTELRGLPRLPMLLRARIAAWRTEAHDYEERFRIGTVIACTGAAKTLEDLKRDRNVLAVESSRPMDGWDCAVSVPAVKADVVHRPPISELGDDALVGIVDDGIDVLHEAFLDAKGNSRILAIWDQRSMGGPRPASFPFGRLYSSTDIAGFVANPHSVPRSLNLGNDHGTHVASIAAGRPTPHFAGGMAPEAKIVVVIPEMKTSPPNPRSIGYSQSHLAALKFIREFAVSQDVPVAVNISLGMNAGAHDGKSLLEAGFDAISENGRLPGFVVVKSAGNERNWHGHARLVLAGQQTKRFEWNSRSVPRGQDYIEIWFKACDELEFQLVAPTGETSAWVSARHLLERGAFAACDNEYDLSFMRYHYDNGDSRLLVRIRPGIKLDIAPGYWRLEARAGTIRSSGEVHAWLERHSARGAAFTAHIDAEMTLSIPGTALTAIAVASVDAVANTVSNYSSFGPTRDGREKPDICAPGENIQAAAAGTGNRVASMSGTSMAAPHATGAIALLLSQREKQRRYEPDLEQLNAAQIQAGIRYAAQGFSGAWNSDKGCGLLDAEALLAAFS